MFAYSLICTNRNVNPSRKVVRMPAFSPKRLPFLIDVWAQCIVNEEDHSTAVFTPATSTGSVVPGAGHGSPWATRMKKYAVKKAPKIITSEMMKSSIPSSWGSTRELRLAGGGPWASCSPAAWATPAASTGSSLRGRSRGRSWLGRFDVLHLSARRAAHALDQVRAQPSRALAGQGGDDHVVDPEQLQRVHGRRVGVGVADHARAQQALAVHALQHRRQARARLAGRAAAAVLLRHHHDEQMLALPGRLAPEVLQ